MTLFVIKPNFTPIFVFIIKRKSQLLIEIKVLFPYEANSVRSLSLDLIYIVSCSLDKKSVKICVFPSICLYVRVNIYFSTVLILSLNPAEARVQAHFFFKRTVLTQKEVQSTHFPGNSYCNSCKQFWSNFVALDLTLNNHNGKR